MKHQLEVYFDYICPYCFRAHQHLMQLIPDYPDIEIVWHPCESHPRPDRYGPHSDLCIQGYFYAFDNDIDILTYHDRMYWAAQKEHVDIENIDALTHYVHDFIDVDKFRTALLKGTYRKELHEANVLAFDRSGVWVVPAYRLQGRKLDAIENIGVSKEMLRHFLDHENQ